MMGGRDCLDRLDRMLLHMRRHYAAVPSDCDLWQWQGQVLQWRYKGGRALLHFCIDRRLPRWGDPAEESSVQSMGSRGRVPRRMRPGSARTHSANFRRGERRRLALQRETLRDSDLPFVAVRSAKEDSGCELRNGGLGRLGFLRQVRWPEEALRHIETMPQPGGATCAQEAWVEVVNCPGHCHD